MAQLGRLSNFLLLLVFTLALFSCDNDASNIQKKNKKQTPKNVNTPKFDKDSCFSFVKKQVDFGPRVPNSIAHKECSNYFIDFFKQKGLEVTEQRGIQKAHDGKNLEFVNIIAKYKPSLKKRIQISAHWDTRPWADQDIFNTDEPIDGANDGASGVAVIMEIARIITKDSLNLGVDFVLFDIEDYGVSGVENSFCYGSQYWYENFDANQIIPKYGINLDMVGDIDANYFYEGFSAQYARPVLDKVWGVAHDLNYDAYFIRRLSNPIIDDHYWVNKAGIPCIDIIHKNPITQGFPDTWHTHEDNIDNISPKMLYIVGNTMIQLLYREEKGL